MLERARGELLVADPYFGHEDEDWGLLDGLEVPVRVLTCRVASNPAPIPAGIQARIRPNGTSVLHDRSYVWLEGGFMLGGSPSTHAPVGVAGLSSADADLRSRMFESLWTSPLFQDLSRC